MHRAQGKRASQGRCGKTIEAKPVFDQTCLIEPAKVVAWCSGRRDMGVANSLAHQQSRCALAILTD